MATTRVIHIPTIFWITFVVSLCLNAVLLFGQYTRTRVISVPDGDSIQLADGRRVRLLGIDAPERGRCMADEAREKLKNLTLHKHVRLKDTVTDDYGRVLSIVIIEDFPSWFSFLRSRLLRKPLNPDPLVNRGMLAAGLAKYTFSASDAYKAPLKQAYEQAKTQKLGIFSSSCRSTNPTTDCVIKGNMRDGAKTYHLPSCDNYSQVIVDEAFGDQWFCAETDAIAAGFVRATGCRE